MVVCRRVRLGRTARRLTALFDAPASRNIVFAAFEEELDLPTPASRLKLLLFCVGESDGNPVAGSSPDCMLIVAWSMLPDVAMLEQSGGSSLFHQLPFVAMIPVVRPTVRLVAEE